MSIGRLFWFLLFSFSCGNPSIIRYLAPIVPENSKIRKNFNETNYRFVIYEARGIRISLKNATPSDIEKRANLESKENVAFRIPSLTYLVFFVENNSAFDCQINFSGTSIRDSDDNLYSTVNRGELEKKFTSVAYSGFNYNNILSFYITRYEDKPPQKGNHYEKFWPDETAVIKPGFSGEQIVAFHRISERYSDYFMKIELPEKAGEISIPLKYTIYRSDRPELSPF
ncbi:MAG: hypothetical protein OEV66_03325 [Spirochaetia bacterium]|nr:hypothetical protein [Spirochaetia bacterium]